MKSGTAIRKMCFILSVICFLLYANTLQNGYVLDDATVVTSNTIVKKGLEGIPELLVTPRLKGYEQARDEESYRPVPLITSAIEYQFFGENPAIGHFFNILFFIGCVIGLFLFLCKLSGPPKMQVAFLAALLFALHPIHTEVVANIKSRDELLCFLFAFFALNQFIDYARNGKLLHLCAGAFLLFLSFISKETSVSFVLLIPLVFFFYVNEDKRRSMFVVAATFVAAGCLFAIRAAVLPGHGHNAIVYLSNPLVNVESTVDRVATAVMVLGMYLKLLFIPHPLICDYSYNTIPMAGPGNIYAIISGVVYLLLAAVGVYRLLKKDKDPWAFSILLFLVSIGLFSNIFFLVYSEMAERFLFFASAGFCLALAVACDRWVWKDADSNSSLLKNRRAMGILVLVCLVFALLTVSRNADWKDNYTLFSTDIEKAKDNCALNFFMAGELSKNEANAPLAATQNGSISYLNRAVAIYPDFEGAHASLGSIYDRLHVIDSGIVHDKRAVELNPANTVATYNLARGYYFLKNYPEAIKYFKKATELQPDVMLAHLNLARCYLDNMEYDSAIVYFNKTLALEPGQQIAKQGLYMAFEIKRKMDSVKKISGSVE